VGENDTFRFGFEIEFSLTIGRIPVGVGSEIDCILLGTTGGDNRDGGAGDSMTNVLVSGVDVRGS
jgi:hypothetical protein